jgi:hypothetical protein
MQKEPIDYIAYDEEEDNLLVSNILDNFEEIDPEEQSMFMNLNIRNRRQKILYKLSFETEVYDIYDPVYTSEEDESDSETSSSSEGTSRSNQSSSQNSQEKEDNKDQKYLPKQFKLP